MPARTALSLVVITAAAFATAGAAEARRLKSFGFSRATAAPSVPAPQTQGLRASPSAQDIGPNTARVTRPGRDGRTVIVVPTFGSARTGASRPADKEAPRSVLDQPDLPASAATPAGPALVSAVEDRAVRTSAAPAYGFREVTGGAPFKAVMSSPGPFGTAASTTR